jgi:hypothetical protein
MSREELIGLIAADSSSWTSAKTSPNTSAAFSSVRYPDLLQPGAHEHAAARGEGHRVRDLPRRFIDQRVPNTL